ncbi:MAG: class I SAM-dependent DNA methyltransferase [Deltaproteobacteria bacterium]|nr:class I SAM-dependent DNA methyltransferase [Deltaproteobacteria bacterium]
MILANAIAFSKKWESARSEKAQSQSFINDFLKVFGVNEASPVGEFEYKVQLADNKTGYIDYLWKKKIAIEMKSKGENLDQAYNQLKNYLQYLPPEDIPDLWLVGDFENTRLTSRSISQNVNFKTKHLRKYIKYFATIAGYPDEPTREPQVEVNIKAGEKMARLHDSLKALGYVGRDLEAFLVRLLFCLFAEDTGIFPKDSFSRFIGASKPDGSDLSDRLTRLFDALNTAPERRDKKPLFADELKRFQFINGSLFKEQLPPADFDSNAFRTLKDCSNFDWSEISPAIFGSMFQGVMDKQLRREIGAHYTSEENILKVIKPLFLDELWNEFNRMKTSVKGLAEFHEKLASLRFLDPACGCGNFLIIAYRELRALELEVLKMKSGDGRRSLDIEGLLKVTVEQFYGIENEEFPCQIAQVGMWLTDHQMNSLVSEEFGRYYARLPLTRSATIIRENALRLDWEEKFDKTALNYILGNPPFVGLSYRTDEQRHDIEIVFAGDKLSGRLDYVAGWYKKAAKFIQGTAIKCAFVSTNSITQGEQAPILWRDLFQNHDIIINFAYRTFVWSNQVKGKAAVHCVIIGFSRIETKDKKLFELNADKELTETNCERINGYLIDAPDIFIETRSDCQKGYPRLIQGSKPWDGGFLILSETEREDLVNKYPETHYFIRRYVGARDFINGLTRYCLWLEGVPANEYRRVPEIMKRLAGVQKTRALSKTEQAQRLAATPALFKENRQPKTPYLLVPETSSENRKYIPIGFMDPDIIASNSTLTAEDANLFHFGALTSSAHMAWTLTVAGRLGSSYRYMPSVYNNFPWPRANEKQKEDIADAARAILEIRAGFAGATLADLYDPLTTPAELIRAHRANDQAVLNAYGFKLKKSFSESELVAKLIATRADSIKNR